MKKIMLFSILGLTVILGSISCKKTSTDPVTTGAEGVWIGSYHNGAGGPLNYLKLNFKAGGDLSAKESSTDISEAVNGSWFLDKDSIRATYTIYTPTSITYSIAGKYVRNDPVINGTLGFGTNSTGAGVFSVTKQ